MFANGITGNPTQALNENSYRGSDTYLVNDKSGLTFIGVSLISSASAEVLCKLDVIKNKTLNTAGDLKRIEQEQEAFALQYKECTMRNARLQQLVNQQSNPQMFSMMQNLQNERDTLKKALTQNYAGLIQSSLTIGEKLKETIQLLTQLQTYILDEKLMQWKKEQQLAGNGASFESNLDLIQDWCESLAELIWANRQQIKDMDKLKQKLTLNPPGLSDIISQLQAEVTRLLSTLITSTFIIEEQPPQVLKTHTRFGATVRMLVGGKFNLQMTQPQVKVTIISDSQATNMLINDKPGNRMDCSGEILHNTGTMDYQHTTRRFSLNLRQMQLKRIKRSGKRGIESVMDEKFCLLFQSQFSVGGGEMMFHVWTLSLPVVVIVHGNQESEAWATVTWDNAFSEPERVPFEVPDKVPWPKVAEMLSLKFKAATGQALTDDNLKFLAEKVFRSTDANNEMLSWSQFCKESLSDRKFTFWEWFYAIMKLTKDHLKELWRDKLIVGFVQRKQAEEMLMSYPIGTFLVRFSDTVLGGVTIAFKSECGQVFSCHPFTSRDFMVRSLADRIADTACLLYLYPDINKEIAFGKYYTVCQDTQQTSKNPYVKIGIKMDVELPFLQSYPNTPQLTYKSPNRQQETQSEISSYSDPMSTTSPLTSILDPDFFTEIENVANMNMNDYFFSQLT